MLYENTASYTPDYAAEIDTEEEILADEISERGNRITLKQAYYVKSLIDAAEVRGIARTTGGIIGILIRCKNIPVSVHALAIAYGFCELNGFHSQSEVAKMLNCTRALVSHYVIGWRDVIAGGTAGFDCAKFRKSNESRDVYRKQATDPFTAAKAAARQRHNKITR